MNPPPIELLARKLQRVRPLGPREQQGITDLPLTVKHFTAGRDIVHEGDEPTMVCMFLGGIAFRYTNIEPDRRQIMAFYIPGDIPDLGSVLLETMDHSLGALRYCTVGQIPHTAILQLFEEHPRLAQLFWRDTLIDCAVMRKWLACVGQRSADACIAHIICEFVVRMQDAGLSDGAGCDFPMTQTDLGDAAGLSTVHVSRTLRSLRERGLVKLISGSVIILDWPGLIKLAQFDAGYLQLHNPPLRFDALQNPRLRSNAPPSLQRNLRTFSGC